MGGRISHNSFGLSNHDLMTVKLNVQFLNPTYNILAFGFANIFSKTASLFVGEIYKIFMIVLFRYELQARKIFEYVSC